MVWPTVHAYLVKKVTENASFQKRSAPVEIFENGVFKNSVFLRHGVGYQ